MEIHNKKHAFFTILFGAFILSFIGLYNGFPLVTSDTGAYIWSGFERVIPGDRPIVYGLFIQLVSMGFSLWFVLFVQNLLTAYVLYELLQIWEIKKSRFVVYYVLMLTFLVFFTGIGWNTSLLIADVFTPILLITLFILVVRPPRHKVKLVFFYCLLLFCCIVHFSHLLIALFALLTLMVYKRYWSTIKSVYTYKSCLLAIAISSLAWLVIPFINYTVEGEFRLSKGSHIFLMAHLVDNGILQQFLNENCDTEEYKDCSLCLHKDSLPTNFSDFMWGGKVFKETGGWLNSEEEYNKIINGTLSQPKFLLLNFYKSFTYGAQQLMRNEIGQGISVLGEGSAPYEHIKKNFPNELNNYMNGKQNQWGGIVLKRDNLNQFYKLLLIGSLLVFFALIFSSLWTKLDRVSKLFVCFTLAGIVLNSFLTAGFNSPTERFQARITWMFPMAILLLLGQNFKTIKFVLVNAIKKA